MTDKPMTHIFLKSCGCLSCAIVDVPEMLSELSKAYNYAQKHNETYQKIPTEQVRTMEWRCPEHKSGMVKVKAKMAQKSIGQISLF